MRMDGKKKKAIVEKKIWNKDYATGMRIPHADIDFNKSIPEKEEKTKSFKKVKVIRKKKKVKKK